MGSDFDPRTGAVSQSSSAPARDAQGHARTFSFDDQVAFAALSGDNNPLHMDAVAARRYLFGERVVHGAHSLLWALDVWLRDKSAPVNLRSIRASFPTPLGLGSEVQYSLVSEQGGRSR